MFILSEPTDATYPTRQEAVQNLQAIYNNLNGGGYKITVNGTRHFNFSDNAVLFEPFLKLRGGLGPIDGRRDLTITVDYIRTMFDKYLKGTDEPLLNVATTKYPEVTFESH